MADDSRIDMKQQFTNLANGAASGELLIEDGVANKCIMTCQDFLVDLKYYQNQCRELVHVDSFGNLGSAKALGKSFDDLAKSTDPGSGSLYQAIQEHIEAVEALEDMLTKARDAFIASDEATKDKIRQAMKNLDS